MMAYKEIKKNHSLDIYLDRNKHNTQCSKMLKAFKDREWVSTAYLRSFAYQYNARILELRTGKFDGKNHYIKAEKCGKLNGFRYLGYNER